MASKRQQITISGLTPDLRRFVERQAERSHRTIANFVRALIAEAAAQTGKGAGRDTSDDRRVA